MKRYMLLVLAGALTLSASCAEHTVASPDATHLDLTLSSSTEMVDTDGDGVADEVDNCPAVPNLDQADSNGDGIGNACDPNDRDGDGVADDADRCHGGDDTQDADGDGTPDACDPFPTDPTDAGSDVDGDGILDVKDNCPTVFNPDQLDTDGDEIGNACDPDYDTDQDGVPNYKDNCDFAPNPDQIDSDRDGIGDACEEPDRDGDGFQDSRDNCPLVKNDQRDRDADGLGDACDPFPGDPTNDADDDGIPGMQDNCPVIANPDQADRDDDGFGDACDTASIEELFEDLRADVQALVIAGALNRGQGNSLMVKLAAAASSYQSGNTGTAGNQIGAFINEVNALVGAGRLTSEQGDALRRAAEEIRALIWPA